MSQVLFGVCWWISDVWPCILLSKGGRIQPWHLLVLCWPSPILVMGENTMVYERELCAVVGAVLHRTGVTLPPSPPAYPSRMYQGLGALTMSLSSPALTFLLLHFPQSTQTQKQPLST